MPIQRCTLRGGGSGYKWGSSGHCYAKRGDALKQMRAIFHSGYKGEAAEEFLQEVLNSLDELTDQEYNEIVADRNVPILTRAEIVKARTKNIKHDNL